MYSLHLLFLFIFAYVTQLVHYAQTQDVCKSLVTLDRFKNTTLTSMLRVHTLDASVEAL